MIHAQKAALRAEFRARRAALSTEERKKRSASICNTAMQLFDGIRTLLLFYPLAYEIDLLPIFRYAREHEISCAFPRCGAEKGEMEFYYVDDLDDLAVGKYGIREPKADAIPVTDLTDALMFVPALAFDREGHRIGYGGGYYDRYLQIHDLRTVGVIYEEFLVDALPRDRFDVSVDVIVTEKRIIRI